MLQAIATCACRRRAQLSSAGRHSLQQPGEDPLMRMRRALQALGTGVVLASGLVFLANAAPLMIIGNDEKVLWDDAGKPILSPAGKDSVLLVDLADPLNPKIVA